MDKIFYNGKIYSIDCENNKYTAIGIEDGIIKFLGNDKEAESLFASEKIDLKGQTMLPGFIDSHLHMLNYAFVNQSYKMFDSESIDQIVKEGREWIKKLKGQDTSQWLYGRGWNELKFKDEQRFLTRQDLDKISIERPILLIRVCGHYAAVNSKAMEIVMKLENTKEYLDQIDEENGILREASVKLCYNAMTEPTLEQLKDMIMSAQKDMNKEGITGIHTDNFLSLPGRNSERIMQAYKELDKENNLTLRVYEQASFTAFDDLKEFIDKGYRTGHGTDYYKIGPIKLYQDGSLGAHTALMNEPYEGSEANTGIMTHTAQDLQNCVDYSYKNDMQILVHAIGDRASDMVCTAYENAIKKYGKKEKRIAINHLQIVSENLFDRMKAQNMLCFIQPVFVQSDKPVIEKLVGRKRAKLSYMWKTMVDKGLVCCGGSDSPVESFSILSNIQIAVTRDSLCEKTDGWHPEEKLSVLEAVKLFTINNAYGSFEEKKKGSLEIGKFADMVVLDKDIFETEPHEINKIRVMTTIVGGKDEYRHCDR